MSLLGTLFKPYRKTGPTPEAQEAARCLRRAASSIRRDTSETRLALARIERAALEIEMARIEESWRKTDD
jgi:hypothetical protein